MATLDAVAGRVTCASALILLLAFLAWRAGIEGISNLYVQSAYQEINRWSMPGHKDRGDEFTRVSQYLTESLRYSPHNTWSLEEMGTFQLRRMAVAADPALAVAAARSAYTQFRTTRSERPASPHPWANLALSKLYLDEQDEELFTALRRADELGPWEPAVQQTVILVGLAVWQKLVPEQRASVVRTMERAMLRNALKVTEIAKSFNRLDLLCAINNNKLKPEETCGRLTKQELRSNH